MSSSSPVDSTSGAPLKGSVDVFNGVKVDCKLLSTSQAEGETFRSLLSESIRVWKEEKRTGVWLMIPNDVASLIPHALDLGFDFHHAKPGVAALIKWLPESKNMIPQHPFTNVGVGAVIFNAKDELLSVQEGNGPLRGRGVWKIPTGMVEPGEHIGSAAEREVWEETGIRASFERLLLFRHRFTTPTANCDLFFVCALKLSEQDQVINIDEEEIEAAKFIPMNQYMNQAVWKEFSLYRDQINPLIQQYKSEKYKGLHTQVKDTDKRYGKHAVYTALPATRNRLNPLIRPLRSTLNFIRRLSPI